MAICEVGRVAVWDRSFREARFGTAHTGEDGHWHVELLHIKSGSDLIICINVVLVHNDENT